MSRQRNFANLIETRTKICSDVIVRILINFTLLMLYQFMTLITSHFEKANNFRERFLCKRKQVRGRKLLELFTRLSRLIFPVFEVFIVVIARKLLYEELLTI